MAALSTAASVTLPRRPWQLRQWNRYSAQILLDALVCAVAADRPQHGRLGAILGQVLQAAMAQAMRVYPWQTYSLAGTGDRQVEADAAELLPTLGQEYERLGHASFMPIVA